MLSIQEIEGAIGSSTLPANRLRCEAVTSIATAVYYAYERKQKELFNEIVAKQMYEPQYTEASAIVSARTVVAALAPFRISEEQYRMDDCEVQAYRAALRLLTDQIVEATHKAEPFSCREPLCPHKVD